MLERFCRGYSVRSRDLDYKYKIGLIDLNVGLEAILCAYC